MSAPTPITATAGRLLHHRAARLIFNRCVLEGACLIWRGAKHNDGSGIIRLDGRQQRCHRLIAELDQGPITRRDAVIQSCGNSLCCEPTHLVVKEHPAAKTAAVNAAKTHCPAGHPYEGDNLFISNSGGVRRRYCRTCQAVANKAYRVRRRDVYAAFRAGRLVPVEES